MRQLAATRKSAIVVAQRDAWQLGSSGPAEVSKQLRVSDKTCVGKRTCACSGCSGCGCSGRCTGECGALLPESACDAARDDEAGSDSRASGLLGDARVYEGPDAAAAAAGCSEGACTTDWESREKACVGGAAGCAAVTLTDERRLGDMGETEDPRLEAEATERGVLPGRMRRVARWMSEAAEAAGARGVVEKCGASGAGARSVLGGPGGEEPGTGEGTRALAGTPGSGWSAVVPSAAASGGGARVAALTRLVWLPVAVAAGAAKDEAEEAGPAGRSAGGSAPDAAESDVAPDAALAACDRAPPSDAALPRSGSVAVAAAGGDAATPTWNVMVAVGGGGDAAAAADAAPRRCVAAGWAVCEAPEAETVWCAGGEKASLCPGLLSPLSLMRTWQSVAKGECACAKGEVAGTAGVGSEEALVERECSAEGGSAAWADDACVSGMVSGCGCSWGTAVTGTVGAGCAAAAACHGEGGNGSTAVASGGASVGKARPPACAAAAAASGDGAVAGEVPGGVLVALRATGCCRRCRRCDDVARSGDVAAYACAGAPAAAVGVRSVSLAAARSAAAAPALLAPPPSPQRSLPPLLRSVPARAAAAAAALRRLLLLVRCGAGKLVRLKVGAASRGGAAAPPPCAVAASACGPERNVKTRGADQARLHHAACVWSCEHTAAAACLRPCAS